ncbi:hypothetical protein BCY91_11865 [Pelobium manganitolerans]|uniref:Right handed beta helix domain-containing protein n=1 Tax=Pelobium manganitolerans TaxID=1842495 RepID=A0A419S1I6_9SPHI|nr:hypothetical protein [Pelobium manganitolerans]RKD12346.1 hypothetical protein BCY91_11865 [Pelobium manganitolerans]
MSQRILTLLFTVFVLFACRKEEKIDRSSNARLQFSTDSLLFDTVFTSSGTTNRSLKIFNYSDKAVLISSISLQGGNTSAFKININGEASTSVSNLKIGANDSIYVFVKAFIDPNNAKSPFLVEDAIEINLNGNQEKIPLVAYGQNAVYLNNERIVNNTSFKKGKPYIIYNTLNIDKNATLILEAGARLYFHKDAKMLIAGSLQANGILGDSITFCSDRQERIYSDEPGQWDGLYFLASSHSNILNYVTLKNALVGATVDSLSVNALPKLLISNSIVKNHQVAGVLGYNASIDVVNSLFYNCGQYLLAGFSGGNYRCYQNTFANYNYNFPRKTPSVYFTNFLNSSGQTKDVSVTFFNNIIYGSLQRELDFSEQSGGLVVKDFQNNLLKTDQQTWGNTNIYNSDPFFLNTRKENYQLASNSPAKESGKNLSNTIYYPNPLSKDILQQERAFPSTLGCFEK